MAEELRSLLQLSAFLVFISDTCYNDGKCKCDVVNFALDKRFICLQLSVARHCFYVHTLALNPPYDYAEEKLWVVVRQESHPDLLGSGNIGSIVRNGVVLP